LSKKKGNQFKNTERGDRLADNIDSRGKIALLDGPVEGHIDPLHAGIFVKLLRKVKEREVGDPVGPDVDFPQALVDSEGPGDGHAALVLDAVFVDAEALDGGVHLEHLRDVFGSQRSNLVAAEAGAGENA